MSSRWVQWQISITGIFFAGKSFNGATTAAISWANMLVGYGLEADLGDAAGRSLSCQRMDATMCACILK